MSLCRATGLGGGGREGFGLPEVCFEGDCLLDAGTVTESVLEPKEVLCSLGSGNITGRDVVTRLSGTEVPLMSGAWFVVLV